MNSSINGSKNLLMITKHAVEQIWRPEKQYMTVEILQLK